jgi:prepilin-type N-terminal cleavage/methylation domain-containing protein
MTSRPRTARGFTLVEAIATMTVIAILGSVSSSLIYSGVRAYRDAAGQAQLHEEMSTALESITRALRGIPAGQIDPVAYPSITAVQADSIQWGTSARLWLSGSNLQFQEDGGTAYTLLTGVTSFSIQCYDEAGTALGTNLNASASQNVRRIQVQVTASKDGATETLRTRVFIRCTMEGALP